MLFYTILPTAALAGVILLVIFLSFLLRDIASERLVEKHIRRVGICSLVVFASLIAQRMIPVAIVFLLAVLLLVLIILSHARSLAAKSAAADFDRANKPLVKLISLEKYARLMKSKPLVKRVLKLNGVVASIRTIQNYSARSLDRQCADIVRMERVYLPRIDSLLNQYVKLSSHDSGYDERKLSDQLDEMTCSLQQILDQCVEQDRFSIDLEASALITAMKMDGLSTPEGLPDLPAVESAEESDAAEDR